MTKVLLPDFLTNPCEYQQAEALWRERWDALMRETGELESWETPWLNTRFDDGTPFRDGDPMFSAVCPSRQLGIRVIQLDPTEHRDEFCAWTDVFAKGESDETRELVISCSLSERTLERALSLMKQWITDGGIDTAVPS